MKKLLFGFYILQTLVISGDRDYNPSKITKQDLAEILKLDSNLYELSKRKPTKKFEISEILNFIWNNREIKIDPLKERFNLEIMAFAGGRNRSGLNRSANEFDYSLNPYAYVGLQGNLKIIDAKEARDKKEEILKQRATILNKIESIASKDLEIQNLQEQLEFMQLKENLYKVRVGEGVESRATRISNLEAILKAKQNQNKAKIDLEAMKLELLDFVKIETRDKLREMLK